MKFNVLKKLELTGKRLLNIVLRGIFGHRPQKLLKSTEIQKVLVLRLDQRIGNGIMLLPLLKAIRKSSPDIEIHLLLHHTVAELIKEYSPGLVDNFWMYNQNVLLSHPLKFLKWITKLRNEHFDLILSSHNPDNFSLSQAILGRWCKPWLLAGFQWGDSDYYYDASIFSGTEKHYSDSQLDLWRRFDDTAVLEWGGLNVPQEAVENAFHDWNLDIGKPCALIWLGATGNKTLPPDLVAFLFEQILKKSGMHVQFALGKADASHMNEFPEWIRSNTLVWEKPLADTAKFFAGFQLFVSGDTGPMHIAAALDIPTLTIFTHSRMEQYGYRDGQRHFALNYSGTAAEKDAIVEILHLLQKLNVDAC